MVQASTVRHKTAPPVILSIAGYDPSSGAGITADIKTAAAHHCYAATCITALTVQTTRGVRRVEAVSPSLVQDTLSELVSDLDIKAVRIGMLGSAAIATVVADFLDVSRLPNVVLDPIVRSSSGADLLGPGGLEIIRDRLLSLVTIATPNIDEAAALTGHHIASITDMRNAAQRLHALGLKSVVITGGHLNPPIDLLSTSEGQRQFHSEHLDSRSTHGTGCAFATALACNLANRLPLPDAVLQAKTYVHNAIKHAYPLGHGIGPVNHLYTFERTD